MGVIESIKKFIEHMNEYGIPIWLMRIDGKPTLTGTMVVFSFLTALGGEFAKIAGFLGAIDLTQANYLLLICLGAYLGRKVQGDGKKVELEDDKKD